MKPLPPPWEVMNEALGIVLSKGQIDFRKMLADRDRNGRIKRLKIHLFGGYSVTFETPRAKRHAK